MRHLILAAMLPGGGPDITETYVAEPDPDLPTLLPGGGPLPPRQRPPRKGTQAEQVAERKRTRKCLLRVARGTSSGLQILEGWDAFHKAGGALTDLPESVQTQIRVFIVARSMFGER